MELPTKVTFEHTYFKSMSDIGTRVVEKGEERIQEVGRSGVDAVGEKKEGEKGKNGSECGKPVLYGIYEE